MDLTGKDIENSNGVREELKRVKYKTRKQCKKAAIATTSLKINATKIIKEGIEMEKNAHTQIYGLLSTVLCIHSVSCANQVRHGLFALLHHFKIVVA